MSFAIQHSILIAFAATNEGIIARLRIHGFLRSSGHQMDGDMKRAHEKVKKVTVGGDEDVSGKQRGACMAIGRNGIFVRTMSRNQALTDDSDHERGG